MIADIRHFIVVFYKRVKWNIPPHAVLPPNWSTEKFASEQRCCYNALLEQLRQMYPTSTVHVITNEKFSDYGQVVCHHFPDMPDDHHCKYEAFGLLDEPAMFLDTDLIIVRPFEKKHIECAGPFNFYRNSGIVIPLYKITDNPPFLEFPRITGGITWIKEP